MAGKLRALKKLEDKAGTAYEVLLAIKQLDEEQPKPKQKRARMGAQFRLATGTRASHGG